MLETIRARRSLRDGFLDEPVGDAAVDAIVESGLLAPSSKNAQPWRLHVVRDRALIARLADAVQTAKDADTYVPSDPRTGRPRSDWPSSVVESAGVLRSAPLCIFVENRGEFSAGRETLAEARPEILRGVLVAYGLECLGLGAAIQNMWLTAQSLGLGGVFMGDVAIAEPTIKSALAMRGDVMGVLALGRPVKGPGYPRRLHDDRVIRHDIDHGRG